ncbi:MAG: phosphate ABC transporter permease PstA [Methanoregula sp.]|uniref:phosphate ABC transporter permease PstA n=1 Tax=Methanoregula sp. TaxID=2052170 RepID=UPI003BB00F11
MNFRALKGTIMMAICGAAALFAAGMLLYILVVIFLKGVASLKPHFILFSEINTGMGLGTGVGNAIAGTILLAVISTILAIPFGVGTAIYLRKYASDNQFTRFLRLMIEVLSGTPSIVLGIFGIAVLVIYLKPLTGGESLIAGAIALGILIIPVIERSTEDALARVPCELEEGSYALGATKWLTIRDIVIPYALSGIIVGAILGFGRAAEESAVVLLTAGYSQYMPQFRIAVNPNFLLGIKIYPLNDLVGSLPVFLYTSYENSNVFPISSIFAAGFVLIVIVLFINLSAKAILFYATATSQGHRNNSLFSLCGSISDQFRRKKPKETPSCTDGETVPMASNELISPPEEIQKSDTPAETVPDRHSSSGADVPSLVPPAIPPQKPVQPWKKIFSIGASIPRLSRALHQGIHIPVHENKEKRPTGNVTTFHGTTDQPGAVRDANPVTYGRLKNSILPFLLTLAPFALVATFLLILTMVLPGLSPFGANGPAGSLAMPLMAIVLCAISTVLALFLVRISTIFLLRHRKARVGNHAAVFAALAVGFCLVFIGAFIFSFHIFSPGPPVGSLASGAPAETGISSFFPSSGNGGLSEVSGIVQDSLFGFLHSSGTTANTNAPPSSNRSAQLAAYLASEETTPEIAAESTPAPLPSPTQPLTAEVSSTGPAVPVKNALNLGESYWYGDNNRPCLVTIYNVTVLPFYFYWDMDWNRFVRVTPVSSGDTFLVIFIRIEDTGNMSAIVPSADEFNVTYNGQSYFHEPYFDTSVLDQNEINIYTANFNAMPYQWIREIGQQKRDYAYLTGYNIFAQNTTVVENYAANSAIPPPTAANVNGAGYFIKPGSSNAIDGYLIYEVPGSAEADLRDTYLQVSFNSFSPTQWRLIK